MSTLLDWTGRPLDAPRRLLIRPDQVFGGTFRHDCLAGCGQVMVVPDRNTPGAPEILTEGQIWACIRCGANHEYYMQYQGPIRNGCVRLLLGNGTRENGEPSLTEFMPK